MGLLQFAFNYQTVTCGECDIPFAMTQSRYNKSKDDGKNFYCPNGHSLVFNETEKARLERELAKEKQRREWAEKSKDEAWKTNSRLRKSKLALKGIITKVKKRVGNGMCPCCNRSFENLHMHMQTKHPTFKGKSRPGPLS